MLHEIETLVNTLIVIFLPIEDITLKYTISLASTRIIIGLATLIYTKCYFRRIFLKIRYIAEKVCYYLKLEKLLTLAKSYFSSNNYIIIKNDSPFYVSISQYLLHKYNFDIVRCDIVNSTTNNYKYVITKITNDKICDIFTFNDKNYNIMISIVNQDNTNMYEICGNCPINILRQYISSIINSECDNDSISLYRTTRTTVDKKNKIKWGNQVVSTNKCLSNTIVSGYNSI